MKERKPWTYKGHDVFPASVNSSGIRWYAHTGQGLFLKADTKEGMRQLITQFLKEGKQR